MRGWGRGYAAGVPPRGKYIKQVCSVFGLKQPAVARVMHQKKMHQERTISREKNSKKFWDRDLL